MYAKRRAAPNERVKTIAHLVHSEDTVVTNEERSDVAGRPLDSPSRDVAPLQPRRRDFPDTVDEASLESFPASDPPSWSSMRAGPPRV